MAFDPPAENEFERLIIREFANKTSRLNALSWEIKVVYTAFLCFTLFAYVVIAILVLNRTGLESSTYADYYQGNEAKDVYGKTVPQLLETTHFHLFSYPVFLLIQGHIFLLCSWPRTAKAWIVVASFVGAAFYLAAPWAALYGGQSWSFVQIIGRVLLLPPLILFLVVPLYEMWLMPSPSEHS